LDRLSKSQPDIVLLDLSLPGVSGSEILQRIRRDSRLDHTRVVVVTAHAHVAAGLTIQPDLLLLKPVSIEQLTHLISRINLSKQSQKAIPLPPNPLDRYTGLYNRSFFVNRLESSLKQSKEIEGYLFVVLLFQVDPKEGKENQVGSQDWEYLLGEIAGALKSILRPTDTLARFDHDTFYILIENVPNGEITLQIANRIQERLYQSVPEIGYRVKIPIRIGILLCDSGYKSASEILRDAKYAQSLTSAQGEEYTQYYYQFSVKK
jgi:diguanylate cyclase (GGDEF)-like protein